MWGLPFHVMLVVRKEVLPNSVLEGFFGRACFAKPWHVLLMHSLMRSCGEMLNKECMGACCVWAGAMKGGAETAEEEIHCWKEKKGGSRDEHATSSNLSVHVIQRLTCWAVQACWQAWHTTHARPCRGELGSALGAAQPSAGLPTNDAPGSSRLVITKSSSWLWHAPYIPDTVLHWGNWAALACGDSMSTAMSGFSRLCWVYNTAT